MKIFNIQIFLNRPQEFCSQITVSVVSPLPGRSRVCLLYDPSRAFLLSLPLTSSNRSRYSDPIVSASIACKQQFETSLVFHLNLERHCLISYRTVCSLFASFYNSAIKGFILHCLRDDDDDDHIRLLLKKVKNRSMEQT